MEHKHITEIFLFLKRKKALIFFYSFWHVHLIRVIVMKWRSHWAFMKTSHLFIKAVVGNNEKAATFAFWLPLPLPPLPLPPPPTPPPSRPPTSPPLVKVPRLHLQREQFEFFEEGPASCHRWKSNLFSSMRCFVIFCCWMSIKLL